MANRSYLYAADRRPTRPQDVPDRVVGLTEWAYDVPLVQRLLLSGDPAVCPSMIFGIEADIGIVADFDAGLRALLAVLQRIRHPDAAPLVAEAISFLEDPAHQGRVIIAEAGEIFDMDGGDLTRSAEALVTRIRDHLDTDVELSLAAIDQAADDTALRELGLGNWSTVLFYDPMG